jgi:hypothetical protein
MVRLFKSPERQWERQKAAIMGRLDVTDPGTGKSFLDDLRAKAAAIKFPGETPDQCIGRALGYITAAASNEVSCIALPESLTNYEPAKTAGIIAEMLDKMQEPARSPLSQERTR